MGNLEPANDAERVREAWEWAIFLRENFRTRARAWGWPEWKILQAIRETEGSRAAGQG